MPSGWNWGPQSRPQDEYEKESQNRKTPGTTLSFARLMESCAGCGDPLSVPLSWGNMPDVSTNKHGYFFI